MALEVHPAIRRAAKDRAKFSEINLARTAKQPNQEPKPTALKPRVILNVSQK